MDAIITFVDGNDPAWRKQYATQLQVPAITKRYRDWGLLKYLLRGIERHMPFINNVFLVVSGQSQVPAWVNRTTVRVVEHRDFIPAEFLPTFNSTTIELFLHRIQGLSNEFIYFNDDIFPVADCAPSDFFTEGLPHLKFSRHLFVNRDYKRHVRNSDHLARHALGLRTTSLFARPQHSCLPFNRELNEEAFTKMEPEIRASISPVRTPRNVNMSYYTDYLYYQGKTHPARVSNKHFSLATHSANRIAKWLAAPTRTFVCINDVRMSDAKFHESQTRLQAAFEHKFPEKSRFEN